MILKEIKTREANIDDCLSVAKIHKRTYSREHIMSYLPIYLLRYFYVTVLNNNNNSFVVDYNDKVVGFIFSGYNTNKAVKAFLNKYSLQILLSLLLQPKLYLRIYNSFLNRLVQSNSKTKTENRYTILSIAVAPEFYSKGVSTALLSQLLSYCKRNDVKKIFLSVRRSNNKAIKLYRRFEFVEYESTSSSLLFSRNI